MYLIFFKKLNSFHVYKTALDFEQVKQEPLNKCVHMSMQFKFDSRYNPLPLEKKMEAYLLNGQATFQCVE